jgi:hypothetical protein
MIRVEATNRSDKLIPATIAWTSTGQVSPKAQAFNPGSVRNTAFRELNLTGLQLLVGCTCFLCLIRLALWAVLRLWLFEP